MNSSNSKQILLILIICIYSALSCLNETRCQVCNIYFISTGIGLLGYYNCDQCIKNTALNIQTNQCDCSAGYYDTGAVQCSQCPTVCSTCSNATTCTSCDTSNNRILASGSCNCADGYQQKNGNIVCQEKPNVLMIVLSSVGSTLCMIIGFIVCAFIRMRRGSQQIHAETRKRQTKNMQAEIQMYYEQNDQNEASQTFWNPKALIFKSQQICSICLDNNSVFMTSCGHYFHAKCIYIWLQNKTACPNCNKQIQAKQVRRWCDRCKRILMPVIMNISIKRQNGKKKKQIIKSTPVQYQYCDLCENQSMSQDCQTINEKGTPADTRLVPDSPYQ